MKGKDASQYDDVNQHLNTIIQVTVICRMALDFQDLFAVTSGKEFQPRVQEHVCLAVRGV
jgi:hypothetical protein